jgi:hypothetical protein
MTWFVFNHVAGDCDFADDAQLLLADELLQNYWDVEGQILLPCKNCW